ncbi:MAG TPA: prepilin-type N-terminal cleavage/methylation domain-containing protein [Candidatus Eisenbacteria bacterium]|nr:prepilin-type N-terminal cleavage/methylation domain-containing protein [Candidatus Eisenbacteria bacterium]
MIARGGMRGQERASAGAPPDGQGGFTLIEIVMIIVIAAIAILPLSMLFANSSIHSSDARNATIAAQLAQAKMEELTADKNSPARGFSYLVAANYPAETPVPAFSGYNRSVSFAPDSTYDGVTFRTVSVTVTCANIPNVTMTTWFTSY